MSEIWKDVKGYEGLYQVSNLGNVRSLDRVVAQDNNGTLVKRIYKGRSLKQRRERLGYRRVNLSKNGKSRLVFVHRIVAEVFTQKECESDSIVNHLDSNPENNNADNLEWTTYKGNMQWAAKQGRMHCKPENLRKAQENRKRAVIATNGVEVLFFDSAAAAEKSGFNHRHISSCCNQRYGYKTHKGYEWRYA